MHVKNALYIYILSSVLYTFFSSSSVRGSFYEWYTNERVTS